MSEHPCVVVCRGRVWVYQPQDGSNQVAYEYPEVSGAYNKNIYNFFLVEIVVYSPSMTVAKFLLLMLLWYR